jgi:hypothetical protein
LVHGSVNRAGVASPWFHHGLHSGRRQWLTGARLNGRSGPWRLAARVATRRGLCDVIRGLLIGAQTTVRRWRSGGGASAPSGYGACMNEEGRRRGEGVRCSTGVWVPFYWVGTKQGWPGMAGGGGNWCLHGYHYQE